LATFYFDFCPIPGSDKTETRAELSQLYGFRKQVRKIHYDKATLPAKKLNKTYLITMIELRELEAEDCGLTQMDLQFPANEKNEIPIFSKLTTLNLKNNRISKIQHGCFESARVLKQLDLYKNDISMTEQFAWGGLKELEQMDLSSNQMIHLDYEFEYLPKLKTLDLSRNRLSYVDLNKFKNNSNLMHLNIKRNNIKRMEPCQQQLGLTSLDLSSNALTDILSLNNAPRIEHLSLSNNQMLKLTRNTFEQWALKMKSLHLMALRQWTEESYDILNHMVNLKALSVGKATQVNRLKGLKELESLTIDGEGQTKIDERELKTQFPKLKRISREENIWEQPTQQPKEVVEPVFEYKKTYETYQAAKKSEGNTFQNHFLITYASLLTIAVVCCAVYIVMKRLMKAKPVVQESIYSEIDSLPMAQKISHVAQNRDEQPKDQTANTH
jgi:Leucine rich repeat